MASLPTPSPAYFPCGRPRGARTLCARTPRGLRSTARPYRTSLTRRVQARNIFTTGPSGAPPINEADMSDKPKLMRHLPRISAQAEFEGKKEELADLDRYGLRLILAALEATSQLANTVIFFTSDNGYLHGEHRLRAKDKPYWECSEVPFFVKGPGVKSGATRRTALVNHTDLMPTTCVIAGISPSSLDVDGRSMLTNLGRRNFSGWRNRMLVSGSNDVGPEMNPGGSNDPSGRWWLLREGRTAFILRENGAKELYLMGSDPYQQRSKARTAKRALIGRLTDTVKAMRAASGETRRQLEAAP